MVSLAKAYLRLERHAEGTRTMATGTIKTIRAERGFGFIARDGAQGSSGELFFHHSAVANGGFEQLREGQHVSFDEEPDPRDSSRRRAVNVKLAEDGGEE
jgi:CspA family cold shock protein